MTRKRNQRAHMMFDGSDEETASGSSTPPPQSQPGSGRSAVDQGVAARLEALGDPLPKLVAFDLDYTLWPLWVDTHVSGPLKRRGENINKVHDVHGQPLSFFPHVPAILLHLRKRGVLVAAASRTSAPTVARQALNGLVLFDDMEPETTSPTPRRSQTTSQRKTVKAMSLFNHLEIYPGSKLTHFQSIKAHTKVPYDDMIFFDDESRNAEVGHKLGVHFHLVGHEGLDVNAFEVAVRQWRAKRKARDPAHNGNPADELLR